MPKTTKFTKKTTKITDNTKQKVEHIKDDAKKYYKWKNMIYRYVLIWFLLILLVLQFLLPNNKAGEDQNLIATWSNQESIQDESIEKSIDTFWFLDNSVDTNNIAFDSAVADIISQLPALKLLYKKSLSILPSLQTQLKKEKMPTDLQYLALLNWLNSPLWMFSQDMADDYGLRMDEDIDEIFNIDKSTQAIIGYMDDLYDNFGDRDLVLIWYFAWEEELEDIMEAQNVDTFQDLYLESYLQSRYYNVMAYKYVMENISDYINTKNITAYPQADTKTIRLWEIKDLVERADKVWYTFKEIRELNTWILWDTLPKWKWELEVYID